MSRLYGKRKAVELYDPTEIDDLVGSIKHRIIEGLHPPRKQTEPVQVPEFSERTKAVLSALAQAEARKAAEKEQRQQADHRTQALLPSEATTQVNSGLAPGRASSFDAQQPEVILQSPESPVSQDHRSDLEDPESVVEEETEDEGEDDDAESPASDVNNNQPSSSRFVQTQEEWSGEDDGDDEDVQEVEDDEEDVRYGDHNGQRRSSPNEVTEQEYLFEEEDELEREDEKEEEGGGVSQGVSYLEDQENDAYASRLPTENTEEQVTWTVSNEGAISESQLGHEAVHAALAEVQNAYQELYQPNTDDLLTSAQIAQAWEELDPALRDATATAPVANEDVNPLSQPNQDDQQTRNISSGEILDQALRSSSVQSKAPSGESPAASDGGLQRPSLETSDARPTAFITSIDTDDQDQEDEDELEADETSENDGSEGRDESSGEEVSEGETSDGEASDDEDQVSSESDADVPSRSIDLVGARQQGIRPDEAEQIIEGEFFRLRKEHSAEGGRVLDDENSAQEVDLSDSDEYDSEEEEADDGELQTPACAILITEQPQTSLRSMRTGVWPTLPAKDLCPAIINALQTIHLPEMKQQKSKNLTTSTKDGRRMQTRDRQDMTTTKSWTRRSRTRWTTLRRLNDRKERQQRPRNRLSSMSANTPESSELGYGLAQTIYRESLDRVNGTRGHLFAFPRVELAELPRVAPVLRMLLQPPSRRHHRKFPACRNRIYTLTISFAMLTAEHRQTTERKCSERPHSKATDHLLIVLCGRIVTITKSDSTTSASLALTLLFSFPNAHCRLTRFELGLMHRILAYLPSKRPDDVNRFISGTNRLITRELITLDRRVIESLVTTFCLKTSSTDCDSS